MLKTSCDNVNVQSGSTPFSMARRETFTYQYRKNKIKLLQSVHAVETEDETEKNGVRQVIRLYYKLKDISRETRLKYQ